MAVITLTQLIGLSLARFVGVTPVEKELESFIQGDSAFWEGEFQETLSGETVKVELRWKDEPSATQARWALNIVSSASVLAYVYLIKKYVGWTKLAIVINDVESMTKLANDIKNVGEGMSPINALINQAGEVNNLIETQNAYFETLVRALPSEYEELASDYSLIQVSMYEGVMEIEDLDEQYKQAKALGTGVGDELAEQIRGQIIDNINEVQATTDDFLMLLDDLKKSPLKSWFTKWGKASKRVLSFLGKAFIVDTIAFLGTLVVAPFTSREQEQAFINNTVGVALEPFNGDLGISWPKGDFAGYYDLSFPLGFVDIVLGMALKEALNEYYEELPVLDDIRSLMLYALLPLEEFMYIKIGGVSIVQDIDFDTTQFLDDLIPNWKVAATNPKLLEGMFDVFLGAVALKALWLYYFKPIVGSIK